MGILGSNTDIWQLDLSLRGTNWDRKIQIQLTLRKLPSSGETLKYKFNLPIRNPSNPSSEPLTVRTGARA